MKYVRCTLRDSRIRSEMSWNSTHAKIWTLEQPASLYSAFVSWRNLNDTLLNTFSRNKRQKNCEESRWRSQSALVWPYAMSCLDAKISLVPKHQLIVPPTLLAPPTDTRTHTATKIQRRKQESLQVRKYVSSTKACYKSHKNRSLMLPINDWNYWQNYKAALNDSLFVVQFKKS